MNVALEQGKKQEEKTRFYLSILDSLSVLISVTVLNENWTFEINKKAEEMINVKRDDVLGLQISNRSCNREVWRDF